MLDQRLLRDDPERVRRELARRGLSPDIASLQGLAQGEKECETRRSELRRRCGNDNVLPLALRR